MAELLDAVAELHARRAAATRDFLLRRRQGAAAAAASPASPAASAASVGRELCGRRADAEAAVMGAAADLPGSKGLPSPGTERFKSLVGWEVHRQHQTGTMQRNFKERCPLPRAAPTRSRSRPIMWSLYQHRHRWH